MYSFLYSNLWFRKLEEGSLKTVPNEEIFPFVHRDVKFRSFLSWGNRKTLKSWNRNPIIGFLGLMGIIRSRRWVLVEYFLAVDENSIFWSFRQITWFKDEKSYFSCEVTCDWSIYLINRSESIFSSILFWVLLYSERAWERIIIKFLLRENFVR